VKAVSVGFGIFMGIIPIWGFQLLVAIALSFLFRLNKALVIVAANISIPPMIPVILFLSLYTGRYWMGDRSISISFSHTLTFEEAKQSLEQYLLGAFTLAILAGLIFGALTFASIKLLKRPGN
jgi:uncharacterized protein (DUF2062 family)